MRKHAARHIDKIKIASVSTEAVLAKKEDEELLQLFVLFLSVGNVLYYISKTVLKNTLHKV